jgi:hypothetical protein
MSLGSVEHFQGAWDFWSSTHPYIVLSHNKQCELGLGHPYIKKSLCKPWRADPWDAGCVRKEETSE